MTKKFYSNPKCKVYPISLNEKLLEGSNEVGFEGGIPADAKERSTDFSFGFDSNEE